MDIFNVLTLIGGLCLFLFGMNVMGEVVAEIIGPRELIAFCFEKVSERPVVEVAVFDLTGRKVLITVLLR